MLIPRPVARRMFVCCLSTKEIENLFERVGGKRETSQRTDPPEKEPRKPASFINHGHSSHSITLRQGYATDVATTSANSGAITAALKTPTADIRYSMPPFFFLLFFFLSLCLFQSRGGCGCRTEKDFYFRDTMYKLSYRIERRRFLPFGL